MEQYKVKLDKHPLKSDLLTNTSLKLCIDDLITTYINKTGLFTQSYFATDIKIFIGVINTFCAIILSFLSVKTEFKFYKKYAIILLSIYFGLNYFFEIYLFFKPNPVFKGYGKKEICVDCKLVPFTKYEINCMVGSVMQREVVEMKDVFREDGILLHEKIISIIDKMIFVD